MGATQIKIFEGGDNSSVEKLVNEWLSENDKGIEVINIKFNSEEFLTEIVVLYRNK